MNIRPAAVAGIFYPDSNAQLDQFMQHCETMHNTKASVARLPRAVIVPHAGHVYSGCAAYEALSLWKGADDEIKTIVMIGPAHRMAFHGMAGVSVDAFATPVDNSTVDQKLLAELVEQFAYIGISDAAHEQEHCLEVELPFLQKVLPHAQILPILNGSVSAQEVYQVMDYLWSKKGVYFLISSDLSHFHDYETAQNIDNTTAQLIDSLNWQELSGERACGYKGIQGVLQLFKERPMSLQRLRLFNSGDTAGDKSRVVGYGSWAIYDEVSL